MFLKALKPQLSSFSDFLKDIFHLKFVLVITFKENGKRNELSFPKVSIQEYTKLHFKNGKYTGEMCFYYMNQYAGN